MYPTLKELLDASDNAHLAALTEPQQEALRTTAITMVEAYAGQKFEPQGDEKAPVTKLIAGTGARELYLPARLEEIDSLSIPSGGITESDVQIAEDGDRIFITRTGTSNWVERALAETSERVFPRGQDMVTISGIWGWTDCPDGAVQAIRFDMEDAASASSAEFAPALQAWRKLGLSGISQGPLSMQLEDRPMTLSPRAADMIDAAGLVWADIGELL